MQSRIQTQFVLLILALILICVRAKSPPTSDAQSKLLVQPLLPLNGVAVNIDDTNKAHHSKPIVNYTDSVANQIDGPLNAGKITEKPEYVNAFATVRNDLNTVKDNIKFLGKTQQMLLETFKSFELHDPEVRQSSGPTQATVPQPTRINRPQEPQYNAVPQPHFSVPALTFSAPTPNYGALPTSAYAEHSNECQNHPNDHPQCTYPQPQYYNNQQPQQYPTGLPNYALPLPYGINVNEDKNAFKQIPLPQKSQLPPQQPALPPKSHQRLLPSLLPSPEIHIPSIATITAKAAVAADLQRLRQLRAERQFQRQSRAQLMLWRRNNEEQAQRTMTFLQQGLVQAFWTVLTVICVQLAPIVLLVIKLLLKSFLPSLLGCGDSQRFLAGPFDLDLGQGSFASRLAPTRFGIGGAIGDSFALNRFLQGGFGESQFGGTEDRLNEQIIRDENELLEDEQDIDSNLDAVDEEDGVARKQTAGQRRRLARLRNINVFR